MSYCRFGAGDVYVYLSVSGHLECCGCSLDTQWMYLSTEEMVAHLKAHIAAGDRVPDDVIPALIADQEENDTFMTEHHARKRQ